MSTLPVQNSMPRLPLPGPHSFAPPKFQRDPDSEDPPLYNFWDMVNDACFNRLSREQLRPRVSFYPSQASVEVLEKGAQVIKGACIRQIYWEFKGEPPTDIDEADGLWKMEAGNAINDMIVEFAKRGGIFVDAETGFFDAVNNISGRADLIYRHPVTKELRGCELKSTGGYQANKGVTAANKGGSLSPKFPHVLQSLIYLDFFNKTLGIREWDIAYFARCTGDRSVFTCSFTSDRELLIDGRPTGLKPEMIYKRFNLVKRCIETDTLPGKDFELQYSKEKLQHLAATGQLTKKQAEEVNAGKKVKKGDPQCGWCQFRSKCWPKGKKKT